jgi:hypothetical protein
VPAAGFRGWQRHPKRVTSLPRTGGGAPFAQTYSAFLFYNLGCPSLRYDCHEVQQSSKAIIGELEAFVCTGYYSWLTEQTFARLGHFQHSVVRYEHLITLYAGLFHPAYALLILHRVLKRVVAVITVWKVNLLGNR